MRLFYGQDGRVHSRLGDFEAALLRMVPRVVASVGESEVDPAATRLTPDVFDDSKRSEEFRRLAGELIDTGRADDVAAIESFLESVRDGESLTEEQADGWLRAINQARLVIGARLGIEEDGWEETTDLSPDDPRVALLHLLGRIQGDLIRALSELI